MRNKSGAAGTVELLYGNLLIMTHIGSGTRTKKILLYMICIFLFGHTWCWSLWIPVGLHNSILKDFEIQNNKFYSSEMSEPNQHVSFLPSAQKRILAKDNGDKMIHHENYITANWIGRYAEPVRSRWQTTTIKWHMYDNICNMTYKLYILNR